MSSSAEESSSLFPDSKLFSAGDDAGSYPYGVLWRQLGVGSCRAILFDVNSRQPVAGRWMRGSGDMSGVLRAAELDEAFRGVEAQTTQWLRQAQTIERPVIAELLSPRRWVYAWPVDAITSLVCQVHYLESRSVPQEFDSTCAQLLCEHWLSGERQARRDALADWSGLASNGGKPESSRGVQSARFALLACTLVVLPIALWLALGASDMASAQLAANQRDHARSLEVADRLASEPLALALSTGDYGEVQQVLTMKSTAGHFTNAAVTNARGQVVALAGSLDGVQIGAVPPPSLSSTARMLPLISGNGRVGSLLVASTRASTMKTLSLALALQLAGGALALAVLGAAALTWWSARRS